MYSKPIYTLLFGMQLCLTTKLMYLMTAYYTPNDSFTANDASFLKTRLASYTTCCSVFSINHPGYYYFTIRGATIPLYELAAKQPTKEHTQEEKNFL